MKNTYLMWTLSALLAASFSTQAQTGGVGIGTTTPAASAALEVAAPDKGLLIPRLDSVARVAIASPATGLLVFQTAPRPGFYYYGGSAVGWLFLADKARGGDNLGNGVATTTVNLQGNALTGTGANLGSVVGVGVRADGGLNIGQNTSGNNVFIGFRAGRANTSGYNNQFIGYQSGFNNTVGRDNQFSGFQSGASNTAGIGNLFSGFLSGFNNTTGNANQFSGYQSGASNTEGNSNQFNGYQSGNANTTGSGNWAFGYESGPTAGDLTNAGAIGYRAKVSQSNTLVLGGTGSDAVRVGIGASSPAAQLEVQLPTASATASLKLEQRGSNLIVRPLSGGNTASVVENTAGNLLLNPSNGNVGVGTTAPAYKLDVAGTIRGNNVSPSDARFKQQVRPLTGALAGALALRGVRYRWNALGVQRGGAAGAEQVGLLAQEVEQIYPELVSTDAEGYKAVNYAQLTPVLLEALRELKAEVDAQRRRAAQAETVLSRFEQRLRELETAGRTAAN